MHKRLLRMIIKQLKKALACLGIIAFKRSSRVYLPEDESYRIVARLIDMQNPVVIDGGAHCGDMVEKLSKLLPKAEFHCFEPDPMLIKLIEQKTVGNSRVHLVQSALGDVFGKAIFNINVSRPTNSLLQPSETLTSDLEQLCKLVEQIEVEVITIDEYCQANAIERVDVIKLDCQGYDYRALKGATTALKKAKIVLVEVLFKECYQGGHLFPDILSLMLNNGFELYTLCGIHYGHIDELLWADAIFVKRPS